MDGIENKGLPAEPEVKLPGIGAEQIRKANATMAKYREKKRELEDRVLNSEQWWRLRNWDANKRSQGDFDYSPVSAWLWNGIVGKHADGMASYPEPNILPRMLDDKEEAKKLSSIVPIVLEQNGFEEVYSDCLWQKLQQGTAIYGVYWNGGKLNGLGDIEIRKVDLLNLYWEPGITDIQDSRNVFHVQMIDNEILTDAYPQLQGKLKGSNGEKPAEYQVSEVADTEGMSLVVDWYYKKTVNKKTTLQYVKYVGEEILYASETDNEVREDGWYTDGNYPFVFDRLFPVASTPCGYSYIDIGKSTQEQIDILNRAIIRNSVMATTPRCFVRKGCGINIEQYANWNEPFVEISSSADLTNDLVPIQAPGMSADAIRIIESKQEELKYAMGNMDVVNGGTTGGATAASAIAALQEAAGRSSRDATQSAYRTYSRLILMVIERIRQFYDAPRTFRLLGEMGKEEYVTYDNSGIKPQGQGEAFGLEFGMRQPTFDVKVSAQKANPYTKLNQNELALQFLNLGFFAPQMADQAMLALDMMDFDGKDGLMQKIEQQSTLMQEAESYKQMALGLIARYEPENLQGAMQGMMQGGAEQGAMPMPGGTAPGQMMGAVSEQGLQPEPGNLMRARSRTAQAAEPR